MDGLVDLELASRLFEKLRMHWLATPDYTGMYRPGYSQAENEAIRLVVEEAAQLDLRSYADLAGNVYILFPGENPLRKAIVSGSHVDAVPHGGQFDGVAGVVAPLAIFSAFKKAGVVPPHDLCAMIIRAEESPWFGQAFIGSKLAVGDLPEEKLVSLLHRQDGRTLAEHMIEIGIEAGQLQGIGALFPLEQTAAFLELHIEQGPLLAASQMPVGIVTSTRGSIRISRVVIRGESGHTGTVPMDMRRDTVRAAAQFVVLFEEYCEKLRGQGYDVVYCVPEISTGKNASPTTIPDECSFSVEARSDSGDVLAAIADNIAAIAQDIERVYNVTLEFTPLSYSPPAQMHETVRSVMAEVASQLNLTCGLLQSGAGHDAAVFANAGVPAGMVFVRHDGKSHRHDETMDMQDFVQGCVMLAVTMLSGIGEEFADMSFVDALTGRGARSLVA